MRIKSKPYIVIIDDNIQSAETEPLVGYIEYTYGKERVKLFNNVTDGIKFINENLSHKIIVLLDIMFGNKPEGLRVFEEIASKTSLVYFILMTGNFESITSSMLVNLVNRHAWYFLKRDSDLEAFLDIIDKANTAMSVRIDGALEEWIVRHSEDDREKPYLKTRSGEKYTLNDMLIEIREGSETGKEFAQSIINLAIDLIARDKGKI